MNRETLLNYDIKKELIDDTKDRNCYSYTLPNGDVIEMIWRGLDNHYHFYLIDNEQGIKHRSYVRYKTIKAFEEDLSCYTKPFDKDCIGYMLDIEY